MQYLHLLLMMCGFFLKQDLMAIGMGRNGKANMLANVVEVY